MKLSEYIKIRGTRQLTAKEAELFGIDTKHRWLKRFKDLEIDDLLVKAAAQHVIDNPNYMNKQVKGRLRKFINPEYKLEDSTRKYLYLMQNSEGYPKIGISKDPIQRARRITTSSGFITECVAYWDVGDYAENQERLILNKFNRYKTQGEWFIQNSLSIGTVEINLTVPFVRVYSKDPVTKVGRYTPVNKSLTECC